MDHKPVGEELTKSVDSDTEKGIAESATHEVPVTQGESNEIFGQLSVWRKLASYGVELRGVQPVPVEERTDIRYLNVGTWLGASMLCLLP